MGVSRLVLSILFPALLGGYIFNHYTYLTRFYALKNGGQRLLLNSALSGFCFLIFSYILYLTLDSWWPAYITSWRNFVPYEGLGLSFTSFSFGPLFAFSCNKFIYSRDEAISKLIVWNNNGIEIILKRAFDNAVEFSNSSQGNKYEITEFNGEDYPILDNPKLDPDDLKEPDQLPPFVSITLDNGKIYVGVITSHFFTPLHSNKSVRILPFYSGYRDSETLSYKLKTNYEKIYKLIRDNPDSFEVSEHEFEVAIAFENIISVNQFNKNVHLAFKHEKLS